MFPATIQQSTDSTRLENQNNNVRASWPTVPPVNRFNADRGSLKDPSGTLPLGRSYPIPTLYQYRFKSKENETA